MSLLPIYDLDTARASVLKRVPPDEVEITGGLKRGIKAIFGENLTPDEVVRRIIADVRTRGDAAAREWTERIDHVEIDALCVPADAIIGGYERTPREVREALQASAARIEGFYRKQPLTSWIDATDEGMLGQIILPIDRIGVYVPGGTAPLPSTLLMSVIPAQVAGVRSIAVCTPPGKNGAVPDVILAAAHIAGIDEVIMLGGAQGIAALAYGTESVPAADKIVGPGNLFVMLAKRQVFGAVGIDGILGPTEVMVIADADANPALVAADLLAQAEHDVLAQALLVTPSRKLAEAVEVEIGRQIAERSRAEIIRESLPGRGGAVIVPDLDSAFEVANAYGAEHLQLSIKDPFSRMGSVKHAGAIFLGEHSFEVLGDYIAGPSHSLPTSGSARFASGLNLMDFVKVTGITGLNRDSSAKLSAIAATIAHAEELDGHAAAAEARTKTE